MSHMLAVALGTFLAKLMDPVLALVCILSGMTGRAWWHFAVAVCSAVALQEIWLHSQQLTRQLNPATVAIAMLAAGVWVGVGYAVRRVRGKRVA